MERMPSPRERARQYLLAHPTHSNREATNFLKCSIGTVTTARQELIAEGKLQPTFNDRSKPSRRVDPTTAVTNATQDSFDTKTTADLNATVQAELARIAAADAAADSSLNPDGSVDLGRLKKVLWRVVNRNVDDRIVVAAASALARIQQEAEARPLGPGKPLTRGQAVERLVSLFVACGPTVVIEALNTWMGKGGSNATQAVEQGIVASASSQLAGTTNNGPEVSSDPR